MDAAARKEEELSCVGNTREAEHKCASGVVQAQPGFCRRPGAKLRVQEEIGGPARVELAVIDVSGVQECEPKVRVLAMMPDLEYP
jgi:hypothetical protein